MMAHIEPPAVDFDGLFREPEEEETVSEQMEGDE